jgi:hypothetical protein
VESLPDGRWVIWSESRVDAYDGEGSVDEYAFPAMLPPQPRYTERLPAGSIDARRERTGKNAAGGVVARSTDVPR